MGRHLSICVANLLGIKYCIVRPQSLINNALLYTLYVRKEVQANMYSKNKTPCIECSYIFFAPSYPILLATNFELTVIVFSFYHKIENTCLKENIVHPNNLAKIKIYKMNILYFLQLMR